MTVLPLSRLCPMQADHATTQPTAPMPHFVCKPFAQLTMQGTVSGVAEVLKKNIKSIEVIGIEPKNSAVINGGKAGFHKIQGIGAGFIPKNYNEIFIDKVVEVSDEDAYKTTVELAKKEGIFVGISSGAAVHTAISVAKKIGKKKKILALAPDSGNRYLSVDSVDRKSDV